MISIKSPPKLLSKKKPSAGLNPPAEGFPFGWTRTPLLCQVGIYLDSPPSGRSTEPLA